MRAVRAVRARHGGGLGDTLISKMQAIGKVKS